MVRLPSKERETHPQDVGCIRDGADDDEYPVRPDCSSLTVFPDVQKLPEHSTAESARALYIRQLRNVGISTWDQPDWGRAAESEDAWITQADASYLHITVWLFTSDGGPDQMACMKDVAVEVDNYLTTWLIHTWCIEHVIHLMAKKNVCRAGKSYWATLAKVTHTWRSPNNPKKLYRTYSVKFGKDRADSVALTIPQRPISGRWGVVSATEFTVLRCQPSEFPEVFKSAFLASLLGETRDRVMQIGEVDESSEDYTAKCNRWAREASADLDNIDFWRLMNVAHMSRAPAMHLQNWLQKADAHVQLPMLELVGWKAHDITRAWDDLISDAEMNNAWGDFLQTFGDPDDPDSSLSTWIATAVLFVMEIRCGYQRRILQRTDSMPFQLALFVWEAADKDRIETSRQRNTT